MRCSLLSITGLKVQSWYTPLNFRIHPLPYNYIYMLRGAALKLGEL